MSQQDHPINLLSRSSVLAAGGSRAFGDRLTYGAGRAAIIGSYARREHDWAVQSGAVAGEINQMFTQMRAARIRESVAEREWHNRQQQMRHSQEIADFWLCRKV